jgi:hypothetical protein
MERNMEFILFWLELKFDSANVRPGGLVGAPSSEAMEETGHGELILLSTRARLQKTKSRETSLLPPPCQRPHQPIPRDFFLLRL